MQKMTYTRVRQAPIHCGCRQVRRQDVDNRRVGIEQPVLNNFGCGNSSHRLRHAGYPKKMIRPQWLGRREIRVAVGVRYCQLAITHNCDCQPRRRMAIHDALHRLIDKLDAARQRGQRWRESEPGRNRYRYRYRYRSLYILERQARSQTYAGWILGRGANNPGAGLLNIARTLTGKHRCLKR